MCSKDTKYTTMYNIVFADVDSSGNPVAFYTFETCINPRTMGKEFNAIGPLPTWFYVGATVHVSAKLSTLNENEILGSTCSVTMVDATENETSANVQAEGIDILLPLSGSKLDKDFDSKSNSSICYINVDGISNIPCIKERIGTILTDSVAEYLDYLSSEGYGITILDYSSREPYSGFHVYETKLVATKDNKSWSMYLNIQEEKFVEYEFYIYLS